MDLIARGARVAHLLNRCGLHVGVGQGPTQALARIEQLAAGVPPGCATATAVAALDISSASGATAALTAIDTQLQTVNTARADLGAIQNRFSSVISNLQNSSENLSAARSRIQDTDYAKETAELTRTQILQQAGTAMLAQAKSVPQNVLSLLQ